MAANAIIPENWFYAPSVYNSRVSSVIPSGHPVRRPHGVYYGKDGKPMYGASQELDFELEMGLFIPKPIPYGSTMDIGDVEDHIFGFVLLSDWSSRDLEVFEMKPLGPFHGKGRSLPHVLIISFCLPISHGLITRIYTYRIWNVYFPLGSHSRCPTSFSVPS